MENCRHERELGILRKVKGNVWQCLDCRARFAVLMLEPIRSQGEGETPKFGVHVGTAAPGNSVVIKDAIADIAAEGMKADPENAGKLQIIAGEFHPAGAHAWTPECEAQGCEPATFAKRKSPFKEWNWHPFRRRLVPSGKPLSSAEVQRGFVR